MRCSNATLISDKNFPLTCLIPGQVTFLQQEKVFELLHEKLENSGFWCLEG